MYAQRTWALLEFRPRKHSLLPDNIGSVPCVSPVHRHLAHYQRFCALITRSCQRKTTSTASLSEPARHIEGHQSRRHQLQPVDAEKTVGGRLGSVLNPRSQFKTLGVVRLAASTKSSPPEAYRNRVFRVPVDDVL